MSKIMSPKMIGLIVVGCAALCALGPLLLGLGVGLGASWLATGDLELGLIAALVVVAGIGVGWRRRIAARACKADRGCGC